MSSLLSKVKIEYFFDVFSPYSWVGFRILQSKRNYLKDKKVHLEFTPVVTHRLRRIHRMENHFIMCNLKRSYILNELKILGEMNALDMPMLKEFDPYMPDSISGSTQLFLNLIKREQPTFFEVVMELIWKRIWSLGIPICRTPHYLTVCREAGLQFSIADNLVSRLEMRSNIMEMLSICSRAAKEGIYNTPWIVMSNEDGLRISFSNVFDFYMLDHFLENRELLAKYGTKLPCSENLRSEAANYLS